MKRIIVLILALLMAFPACGEIANLTGEIVSADKHGNVATDLNAEELFARFALGDVLAIDIAGQRVVAPLVTRYSDVNMGEPLVYAGSDGQVCFAANYKSFQDTYLATPGTEFEIELVLKKGYLNQYEIRNLVRSESRGDYASDEIFANFRAVINGVLYRAASPIIADDPRSPYVMQLAKDAGINAFVNLAQSEEEIAEMNDPYGDTAYVAAGMGADPTSEEFAPALNKALTFMLENDGPYLVHCNEGKDRAGIVCALIEAIIGFTPAEITEDYMQSYINYYGVEKGSEKYDLLSAQIGTIMESILGAPMNETTLKTRAEAYFKDKVGIDPQNLRDRLLPLG